MKKLLALPLTTVLFICLSSSVSAQTVLQPAVGILFSAQDETTGQNQPVVALDIHANFFSDCPVTVGAGFFVGATTIPDLDETYDTWDEQNKPNRTLTFGLTLPVSFRIHQGDNKATYITLAYGRSLYVFESDENYNSLMVGLSWGW